MHTIVEGNDGTETETFMAIKFNVDGQPLPDTWRTEIVSGAPVDLLLNPNSSKKSRLPLRNKAAKPNRKRDSKKEGSSVVINRPERFDVVPAVSEAPKGKKFEILWSGHASGAKK